MNPWLERLQRVRHARVGARAGMVTGLRAENIVAVKVWSTVLNTTVWMVADDLPREAWPTDAPVYAHAEVKLLIPVGRAWLASVHLAKGLLAGRVIQARPIRQ